jgi:hypothetical protein
MMGVAKVCKPSPLSRKGFFLVLSGPAASLVTTAIEPAAGTSDETVEEWYKSEVSCHRRGLSQSC